MLLSSFPLTLVVEADGTDSGAASTGKKFKSLFTMNTVQNIYKVTMQGDQGSRDGLVGKVLCIYIHTGAGKGGRKDSTRSPLLPLTLALLHNPHHSSKQTLQMGSGTGPGNLHTKREQVQTNSNSPTIQPQEAQSHQLQ